MMRKTLAAGLTTVVVAGAALAPASAAPELEGLWGTTTTGGATTIADCGSGEGYRQIDSNGFCVIDDANPNPVELGVKFVTSEPVAISGIRVYRADPGAVTGTLWTTGGEKLASGMFVGSETHTWQDLLFAEPVAIVPGETYVASYYSPNTVYAFEWYYFSAPRTVGPLTALDSGMGDGNGVFCYDNDPCGGLPTYSYNDSNYWVTPVLWSYPFSGFQQPIDTALMNKGKAGSAIPVKFSLGGDEGMDILREGYPKAKEIQCEAGEATDRIEETVSASASGLKYDPETGQYMYVWKTDKSMANSCFKFDLGLDDYSVHTFTVKFTK